MLVALRCCNRAIRFFFQTVLVDLLTKAALRFSRLLCSRDDARPHAIWVWDAIQMSLLALIVHARPVLQEQVSFIIPRNVLQGLASFCFPEAWLQWSFILEIVAMRLVLYGIGVAWDWVGCGTTLRWQSGTQASRDSRSALAEFFLPNPSTTSLCLICFRVGEFFVIIHGVAIHVCPGPCSFAENLFLWNLQVGATFVSCQLLCSSCT